MNAPPFPALPPLLCCRRCGELACTMPANAQRGWRLLLSARRPWIVRHLCADGYEGQAYLCEIDKGNYLDAPYSPGTFPPPSCYAGVPLLIYARDLQRNAP